MASQIQQLKDYLRNNPNLKSSSAKEYVDKDTFLERIQQMKKITNDIIYFAKKYFYIVSLDQGKCLINPYPKQQQVIKSFVKYPRCIILASRQTGKSTSYSIYVLWYAITHQDKNILICANKLKTAVQILGRIKMAYQMLPSWLKPGITKWNSMSIHFSNGCKINAQATSESSGRGSSINILLLDEFAFIAPNLQEAFMQSVFPVISSSKSSQVIIVSTPNGTNNEYYRIWNKASLNLNNNDQNNFGWHSQRIDWFDVPGRDENWKKQQLATFNGDLVRWNQQYGNTFLGSSQTLINPDIITKFRKVFEDKTKLKHGNEIQLHPDFPNLKINVYVPPQKGRAYIIGGDPSTGMESDFHAMTVWDITNLYNIELVADFYGNNVPPKYFAYMLAKTGALYNMAYIAIENNGVSYATVDKLCDDFQYENVIHDSTNKKSLAIASSDDKKLQACIHFKQFIEDPLRNILIYNGNIIEQMQRFQKKSKIGKLPKYGCFSGHDDLMMSMIWAFYYLRENPLDNYYEIKKYAVDKLGNELPLIVSSPYNAEDEESKRILNEIDKTFKLTAKSYDLEFQDLQRSIEKSQEDLMKNFVKTHDSISNNVETPIDPDTGEQLFQFNGFIV